MINKGSYAWNAFPFSSSGETIVIWHLRLTTCEYCYQLGLFDEIPPTSPWDCSHNSGTRRLSKYFRGMWHDSARKWRLFNEANEYKHGQLKFLTCLLLSSQCICKALVYRFSHTGVITHTHTHTHMSRKRYMRFENNVIFYVLHLFLYIYIYIDR